MKKWLKSDVCGSINNTQMHCSRLKSQQNWLWKKKKKTENANIKCKSWIQTQPLFDLLYSNFPRSEGSARRKWRLTSDGQFNVSSYHETLNKGGDVSLEMYLKHKGSNNVRKDPKWWQSYQESYMSVKLILHVQKQWSHCRSSVFILLHCLWIVDIYLYNV